MFGEGPQGAVAAVCILPLSADQPIEPAGRGHIESDFLFRIRNELLFENIPRHISQKCFGKHETGFEFPIAVELVHIP